MTQQDATRNWYHERIDDCEQRLEFRRWQDDWLSRARVATFLPALGLALYALFWSQIGWPWLLAAGCLLAAFVFVVRRHEAVLLDARELRQRLLMNQTQLARLDRRWDAIPTTDIDVPSQFAFVANDLDLFGPASLFDFVSLTHTPFGRETLRDWLLAPAAPAEVVERQQAVRFLAPHADLREELDLRGRMLGSWHRGTLAFVEWAEAPPFLAARPWLTSLIRLSTLAFVVAILAAFAGAISGEAAFLAIVAVACVNLFLIVFFGGRMHDILGRVTSRSYDLRQYRPLLAAIAALPEGVPFFARLHARMGNTPREPMSDLAALMRLVRFANLRRDGLFGVPYYASQLFLLTDFHVVARMENWKRRHGANVRRWLDAVGQVEAISSLATLAHDHPQWTFPTVDAAETAVAATQLAHPLLADSVSVPNDVQVGPPGSFVLVTGSNMSGKSTLLRAVGLNVTLAQMGAPVSAQEFRLPPVDLATCIRIRDSLTDGVSFFLAELRRLKQVVDQSRADSATGSRQLLYLLDEILQGTNSAERHVAVVRVIGRLVENRAIGMVSTHDLELAGSPELTAACRVVHFRESFVGRDGEQQMTFDYQLRPGLAPTTNALKLLDFVGLND
jgi:hypothetical protein